MTKVGRQQMTETLQILFNISPKQAKKVKVRDFIDKVIAVTDYHSLS